MSDLKYAAKLALEALKFYVAEDDVIEAMEGNEYWVEGKHKAQKAIKALEEALAKQEQRSVSEQLGEPVGIVESAIQGAGGFHVKLTRHVMPMIGETLYTTPQQRKPLTDDECLKIVWETNTVCEAIRKAEAAHGIKENT
jgi:sulfur transfer complex TusBCD TusB component (DsrH family)